MKIYNTLNRQMEELVPADGKTLEELYAAADAALYRAKKQSDERTAFAPGCFSVK